MPVRSDDPIFNVLDPAAFARALPPDGRAGKV